VQLQHDVVSRAQIDDGAAVGKSEIDGAHGAIFRLRNVTGRRAATEKQGQGSRYDPRRAKHRAEAPASPSCRRRPGAAAHAASDLPYSRSANTQSTPPCGTSVFVPRTWPSRACIRCASTPHPDWTATYCTPSTAYVLGTPVMPELVLNSHRSAPVFASKAWKWRSFVPPAKTSPPPVVSTGPQFMYLYVWVHARWPGFLSQACNSPLWGAPRGTVVGWLVRASPLDRAPAPD